MKKIYYSVLFSIIYSFASSQQLSATLDVLGLGANCHNNGIITVTASGGTPPYTYSIDGGAPSSMPYLTGIASGNHTVVVTDAAGTTYSLFAYVGNYSVGIQTSVTSASCSSLGSIIITPVILAGGPSPFQFSIDGINWQSNGGHFNNLSAGSYTAYVLDADGCSASQNVVVELLNNASVNAGPDAMICAGSSTQLTATSSSSNPTYQWSPATGLSDPNIANPVASPATNTLYTVTMHDGSCIVTDNITITVDQSIANAGADATICPGSSITLSGSGGLTYNWTPSTGLSNTSVANPTATPATTTEYLLTTVDAAGCTAQDVVIITIDEPIANAGPDVAICLGNNTTLSGSGAVSYSWIPSTGLSNASVANPVATASITTAYTLTTTDAAGCAAQDVVVVTVSTLNDPEISLSAGLLTVNNPDGAAAYTWQALNNGNWEDIPGTNGTSYLPTVNGIYRVKAVVGPCVAYSSSLVAGRPASSNPYGIYLYPNPSSSIFRLDAIQLSQNWELLEIINSLGTKVLAQNIANRTEVAVNISALSAGIYTIRLKNHAGKTTTFRFLKQ